MDAVNNVDTKGSNVTDEPNTGAAQSEIVPKRLAIPNTAAATPIAHTAPETRPLPGTVKHLLTTGFNVASGSNEPKRLIRKIITVIDPKKLQQSGLDRKIAEALSRQKLATLKKDAAAKSIGPTPFPTVAAEIASTSSATTSSSSNAAIPAVCIKKIVPPKITITRPVESPTEMQADVRLEHLNPAQRLIHAKSILNKKLLMKARAKSLQMPPLVVTADMASAKWNSTQLGVAPLKATSSIKVEKNTMATAAAASIKLEYPPVGTAAASSIKLEYPTVTASLEKVHRPSDSSEQFVPRRHWQSPSLISPTSEDIPKASIRSVLASAQSPSLVSPTSEGIPKASIKSVQTPTKTVSPIKSPQQIARVLDFSNDATSATETLNSSKNTTAAAPSQVLNSSVKKKKILTLNTKPALVPKSVVPPPRLPTKKSANDSHIQADIFSNFVQETFQHRYFKKEITQNCDDIPKAAIKKNLPKSRNTKVLNSKVASPSSRKSPKKIPASSSAKSQPIEFPEVSPLKQPFPSIGLSKEAPLPTISTFKKPFPATVPLPVKVESFDYFEQNNPYTEIDSTQKFKYSPEHQQNYSEREQQQQEPQQQQQHHQHQPHQKQEQQQQQQLQHQQQQQLQHQQQEQHQHQHQQQQHQQHEQQHTPHQQPHQPYQQEHQQQEHHHHSKFKAPPQKKQQQQQPHHHTKSLIVLENKVLSQDEKIDLNALGLANTKLEADSSLKFISTPHLPLIPHTQIKQEQHSEEFLPVAVDIVTKPKPPKRIQKVIQTAEKLKLSPDKIAALAKKIQAQQIQAKKQSGSIIRLPTKIKVEPLASTTKGPIQLPQYPTEIERDVKPFVAASTADEAANTLPKPPQVLEIKTLPRHAFKLVNIKQEPNTSTETDVRTLQPSVAKVSFADYRTSMKYDFKNPLHSDYQLPCSSNNWRRRSAAEIVKEPYSGNASISAVDFIASLASSNPITEETALELSPEELNLNASFAMNLSPIRIPFLPQRDTHKPRVYREAIDSSVPTATDMIADMFAPNLDVQIGNIVTIPNTNVFKTCPMRKTKNSNKLIFTIQQKVENVIQKSEESLKDGTWSEDMLVTTPSEEGLALKDSQYEVHEIVENDLIRTEEVAATETVHNSAEIVEDLALNESKGVVREQISNKSEEHISQNAIPQGTADIKAAEVINDNDKVIEFALNSESGPFEKVTQEAEKKLVQDKSAEPMEEASTPKEPNPNIIEQIHSKEFETTQTLNVASESPKELALGNENHSTDHEKPIEPETAKVMPEQCTTKKSDIITTKRISRFKKGKINLVQRKISTTTKTVSKVEKILDKNVIDSEPVHVVEKVVKEGSVSNGLMCNENLEIRSIRQVPNTENSEIITDEITSLPEPNADVMEITKKVVTENHKELEKVVEEEWLSLETTQTVETNSAIEDKIVSDVSNHEDGMAKCLESPTESGEIEPIQVEPIEHVDVAPEVIVVENSLNLVERIHEIPKEEEVLQKLQNQIELIARDKAELEKSQKHISQLINPPKMPKRKSRALQSSLAHESLHNEADDRELPSTSVSLIEAIKEVEEAPLAPPKIPFKRKSLEPKQSEEPIGIKNLLKQIEDNKLKVLEDVEHNKLHTIEPTLNEKNAQLSERSEDKMNETNETVKDLTETELLSERTAQRRTRLSTSMVRKLDKDFKEVLAEIPNCKIETEAPKDKKKVQKLVTENTEGLSEISKYNPETETPINCDKKETKSKRQSRRSVQEEFIKDKEQQTTTSSTSKSSEIEAFSSCKESKETPAYNDNLPSIEISIAEKTSSSKKVLTSPTRRSTRSVSSRAMAESPTELCPAKAIRVSKTSPKKPKEEEPQPPPSVLPIKMTRLDSEPMHDYTMSQSDLDITDIDVSNRESFDDDTAKDDSSQDQTARVVTTNRKRLRKTVDDIKKKRALVTYSDSDDDDDDNNQQTDVRNEDVNAFLGFDETSPTNKKIQTTFELLKAATSAEEESCGGDSICITETRVSTPPAVGTLTQPWLTTGKAISPTPMLDKKALPVGKTFSRSMPLKKRWEMAQNPQEETDITDDTSPADDKDDEDDVFNDHLRRTLAKRSLEVNHLNVEIIAAKKLKISEEEADEEFMETEEEKNRKNLKLAEEVKNMEAADNTLKLTTKELKEINLPTKNVGGTGTDHEFVAPLPVPVMETAEPEELAEKPTSSKRKRRSRLRQSPEKLQVEIISSKRERKAKTFFDEVREEGKVQTIANIPKKRGRNSKKLLDQPTSPPQPEEEVANKSVSKTEELPESIESETSFVEIPVLPKTRGRRSKNLPQTRKIVQREPAEATTNKQELSESIQSESLIVASTPLPKKRVRKPRNANISGDTISPHVTSSIATAAEKLAPKRSQPKSIIEYFECSVGGVKTLRETSPANEGVALNSENTQTPAVEASPSATDTKKSRGRRRNSQNTDPSSADPFNPRLLLIRQRAQLDTDEVLTETTVPAGKGLVQCGLCLARIKRLQWIQHLGAHYGVGWLVGEKELNVNDRSCVFNTMITFYKTTAVKGLSCRMCSRLYRSALGLLTHIEMCGAVQERIVCEYCSRDYTKLSLSNHLRTCAERLRKERPNSSPSTETITIQTDKVLNNFGRAKRVSLMKAESKLKAIGEDIVATESAESDPKNHIKYEPPREENPNIKWLIDLKDFGKAFCPHKICKFNSNDLSALEEHLPTCKFERKVGHHCLICKKVFAEESEAFQHLKRKHKTHVYKGFAADSSDADVNMDDESSEDDDCSSGVDSNEDDVEVDASSLASKTSKKSKKRKKTPTVGRDSMIQSSNTRVYSKRSSDVHELVAKKWLQFTEQNYANLALYTNALPLYTIASLEDWKSSLPCQEASMKFCFSQKSNFKKEFGAPAEGDTNWLELKRFEKTKTKNEHLIFLGAPSNALVWAPLPTAVHEQYLAVAYREDIDKYTRYLDPKQSPTFVLVYKFAGHNSSQSPQPQLLYAVGIPDGPVHCLSFLPSGGYDANANRLGLLAVGTASSSIKIYALPLSLKECTDDETLTVIDLKPSFTLSLDLEAPDFSGHGLTETQCLQICWSETSSHKHIFASFSTGGIGIWDITDDENENLNRFMVNDVCHFVPVNYFYAGEKRIRSLVAHYDTNGPRWLALACAARKLIVYDIRDLSQPFIVKDESSKNLVLSMDWSPVWESFVISYSDICLYNSRYVIAMNPVGMVYHNSKIDSGLGSVTQVHFNPVQNILACGTDNGDVVFLNPRELVFEDILTKTVKNSRAISTMDLKCLNGEPLPNYKKYDVPEDWQMREEDYKQKYGLVFDATLKFKPEDKGDYFSEKRIPPCNVVRYMRITSLRCNLNSRGRRLVAVGYENGFLRIMNFNRDAYFEVK